VASPLKLTQDEKDELYHMFGDGRMAIFSRILKGLVDRQQDNVLKCIIDNGEKELIYKKLRSEGAEKLAYDLTKIIKDARKETNDAT